MRGIPGACLDPDPHPRPTHTVQAFANVVRRMLEAAGRGMWKPDAAMVERLQELYDDMDDRQEGVLI